MTARPVQLAFVRRALDTLELSPTGLARAAKINPSTLTRFLSEQGGTLRPLTLQKIGEAARLEVPGQAAAEDDAEVRSLTEADWRSAGFPTPGLALEMRSNALSLEGIEPGDELLFERDRMPKAEDILCVRIAMTGRGTQSLRIRLYEPPFLVPRSPSRHPTFLAEGSAVEILGVLERQRRDRKW
jgi:hypothetical protein